MRTIMAFLAALFLCVSTATADKWPTTKFDIYKGDPGYFSSDDEDELPPQSELNKLEYFLEYSAKKMEAWGFPAPNLEIVSTDTCNNCFRMYLDEIPSLNSIDINVLGGTSDFGWTFASGDKTVIQLERRALVLEDEFTLDAGAYKTAVHELFHAVQFATPHWRNNDTFTVSRTNRPGKWVSEGTADAVANYLYETYPARSNLEATELARRLETVRWKKLPQKQAEAAEKAAMADARDLKWRLLGIRLYSEKLPIQEHDSGALKEYHTSSFWRYLAEYAAARAQSAGDVQPMLNRDEADFSYLVRFFRKDYVDNTEAVEIDWLDNFLAEDTVFTRHLGQAHAEFLTSLANYWKDRMKGEGQRKDTWLPLFFGKCLEISFRVDVPTTAQKFEIPETAGRCVELKQVGGYGPVSVDIQIETGSEAEANQLWVGVPDERRLSQREQVDKDSAQQNNLAIWKNYVVKNDEPALLIITNTGNPAAETKPVNGTIRVTLNTRDQHTQNVTAPDPSAYPDTTESTLAMQMAAAGTKTTLSGQFAMMVMRSDDSLSIRLGSSPAILDAMSGAHGSGGFMDHLLVRGSALGSLLPVVNGAIAQNADVLETVPGAEVLIGIPRIEYGFTGTIQGAHIRSSGGTGPELYAVGPKDSLPGPESYFAPSGTVTITEYSREVLAGSYQASLVNPELTSAQRRQSQPVLPVISTVEEHFMISAPWTHLSETANAMPVDPWGELESDILKRMPLDMVDAGHDMIAEARRASEEGRDPNFSAITTGRGAAAGSCDCSCAGLDALTRMGEAVDAAGRAPTAAERQLAACGMTCSAQYAICEGD